MKIIKTKKYAATQRWHNAPGYIVVRFKLDRGRWTDTLKPDQPIPGYISQLLQTLLSDPTNDFNEVEMVIDFASSGYHTPASMYGGSDHLGWPAEGEDERKITNVTLEDVEVPSDKWDELYYRYEDAIMAADVDEREYDDGPDPGGARDRALDDARDRALDDAADFYDNY